MAGKLGGSGLEAMMKIGQEALALPEFRVTALMRVIGDTIIERGAMVNVAPIGRPNKKLDDDDHKNRDLFHEYDLRTGYRRRFMAHLTRELSEMAASGLFISLGGETSFDLVIEGNDKSFPLQTLLDEGFDRVWYIGDALFPGEAVSGGRRAGGEFSGYDRDIGKTG